MSAYSAADGLKLYLEQSGDSIIHNMFYNGWTHARVCMRPSVVEHVFHSIGWKTAVVVCERIGSVHGTYVEYTPRI